MSSAASSSAPPPAAAAPAPASDSAASSAAAAPKKTAKGKSKPHNRGNNEQKFNPEKKKRPEVQHYKPPPAASNNKENGKETQKQEEENKPAKNNRRPRGGGGNKGQGQGQSQDKGEKQEGGAEGGSQKGNRRKKKPEQQHYQPKKGEEEKKEKEPENKANEEEKSARGQGQGQGGSAKNKRNKNKNKDKNKEPQQNDAGSGSQQQDGKSNRRNQGKGASNKKQNGVNSEQQVNQEQKASEVKEKPKQNSESKGHNDEENRSEKRQEGGRRREFRRGGGRGGGGGGGANRQSSSPHRQKQGSSRRNSPVQNDNSQTFHNSNRFRRRSLSPPRKQRTPSPRRGGGGYGGHHQDHHRQSASPKPLMMMRTRGNGRNQDWGHRYFRESSYDNDYHYHEYNRWDDRGGKGGGRGGRHIKSAPPPRPSLPPRLQRVREQQMQQQQHIQSDDQYSSHRDDYHNRQSHHHQRQLWRDNHSSSSSYPRRSSSPHPPSENDLPFNVAKTPSSSSCVSGNAPSASMAEINSRVSDWSLEVEEEEERLEQRRSSVDKDLPMSGGRGGIIRLPNQQRQQQNQNPWDRESNDPHPAWRGEMQPQMHHLPPSRESGGYWGNSNPQYEHQDRSQPQQRYLFDPKNPNKPIPARSQNPPGLITRFPVDNRFPPRMMPPPRASSQSSSGGYRPPFGGGAPPPTNVPPPPARPPNSGMPEWYDVYNHQIYDNKKHDINVVTFIARNDMRLRQIYMEGGGKKLCQLWDTEVRECRKNIQQAFEHLLKTDLVFCAEHDVEFHIWKIVFYQLVEVLKQGLKEAPAEVVGTVKKNMSDLLDEGIEFYQQMLDTLDTTYKLDLDTYYDVLEPRPSDKEIRCALMSAQKCLLCLGDLARYKEQIQDTSSYGQARQYYQKASNIETRNGRPFNQLAILAVTTKRKFEAIYYNMRCLQSKNPFASSHEALTVIFEEVRKKWEAVERKRIEDKEENRRLEEKRKEGPESFTKGTRLRKEIWMRPDGGRRLHRTTSVQESDDILEDGELQEMSTVDLNRRFNNTFLYLIGKLYTRINMETFSIALEMLQKEFRVLVSRSPLPIDSKRLVQIMALNMFVIEHTRMKEGDKNSYRSAMQDAALQLSFDMFGILVERCNVLLEGFHPVIETTSQCLFPTEDLPSLLSAVKVWCDWLLGNNDTWYPVVREDPFDQLARLATHVEKLKSQLKPIWNVMIMEDQLEKHPDRTSFELVKLHEDAVLCGFNPWFRGLDWLVYRRYAPRSIPTNLAHDARRLEAINFCIDFLEGLEPPILKWSLPDNAHISLVRASTNATPVEKANAKLSGMLAVDEDILEESYSDEDEQEMQTMSSGQVGNSKVMQLKHRKDELQRRRREEDREARKMQKQILNEHVSTTLEINPKYIVPDTNCFVDHLNEIRRIASSSHFQIRVPLTVLNELDGLGKRAASANDDHAAMVTENAKRALQYLRSERPSNLKCVTSKGTMLASMSLNVEDNVMDDGKNNDDLILDSCLNTGKNSCHVRGKMKVVYREVVLLTDDRNLKLKAHLTDVPVNKLRDFINWAFSN